MAATAAQTDKARPLLWTLAGRFLLVALLPILTMALLFYLYYAPLMRSAVEQRQQLAADTTAQQLQRHFSIANRELSALAALFRHNRQLPAAQLQTLLDAYADSSDFYEAIYLTDAESRIQVIGLPQAKRHLRQNLAGLDLSARDFVRQAHQQQQAYWSNSFLSTVSARPAVALALPVGRRSLVGEVAISPLPQLAHQLSLDGTLQVRIVDRQYQLIADSQRQGDLQQLNLGHLAVLQDDAPSPREFTLDGQRLTGLARQVDGPGWRVLVAQPVEQAYALIQATWQRLLIALGLTLTLGLLFAGATSWALAGRISLFSRHARAIAAGDYQLPLEHSRIAELNDLSHSLQRMVAAIHERESDYRELNASLEQRINDRTEALRQSNSELSSAMQILQHTQSELVQSEKLAALGALVAGIAHELNTPIGNSLMAASSLQDFSREVASAISDGTLKRSALESFLADNQTASDILIRNLRRASELISSFKQVAVDQASAQRRQFHLDEVVSEILITLGPSLKKTPYRVVNQVQLHEELDSYPGPLGQVLVNLINNALLHAFHAREQGCIELRGQTLPGDWLELQVCDDGIGIADEHLPRIFDPFFTTRLGQGGSGLGLHIVHNLVSGVLGGKLSVRSQLGQGTCFTLRLPRVAPLTSSSPPPPDRADASTPTANPAA